MYTKCSIITRRKQRCSVKQTCNQILCKLRNYSNCSETCLLMLIVGQCAIIKIKHSAVRSEMASGLPSTGGEGITFGIGANNCESWYGSARTRMAWRVNAPLRQGWSKKIDRPALSDHVARTLFDSLHPVNCVAGSLDPK